MDTLRAHVRAQGLGPDDLLFAMSEQEQTAPRPEPVVLPDPDTLGLTEPNAKGRRYRNGTTTGYAAGQCRCDHGRAAVAAYRAAHRASGRDPSGRYAAGAPSRRARTSATTGSG